LGSRFRRRSLEAPCAPDLPSSPSYRGCRSGRMWRFAKDVADVITSTWQGTGPSSDRLGVRALQNARDCTIRLDRRPLPGLSAHIVPAILKDGMIVAWQDVDVIVLQRFSRNCVADGSQVEINSTEDFWRRPGQNGLTDVAALPRGAAAVVWTLDGDVWLRVVRAGTAGVYARGGTVRVNDPDRFLGSDRSEARVVPNPGGDGFVVVWSSWNQDGDGWGVFARPFELDGLDARPMGEEKQVNQIWKHFQWQPQLKWCGDALWALWANGTTGQCWGGSDCATGPFLRLLAREGSATKDPQEAEIEFNGDGPIAAALACSPSGNQLTAGSTAVFWLQPRSKGGSEVRCEFSEPKEHLHGEGDSVSADEWLRRRRLAPLPVDVDSDSLRAAVPNTEQVQVNGTGQARNLRAQDIYDLGAVSMIAHKGLVVILTSSLRGELGAQLLDFGSNPVAYPRHQIAVGVKSSARAAWDAEGDTLALVTCSATGGAAAEDEMPSSFVCARHPARWLMESGGLEVRFKLTLVVMMLLVSVFCCLRYCQQHGRIGPHGRAVLARRVRTGGGSQRPRRSVNQTRLRELREQLAQIPMVAVEGSPAAQTSSGGTEHADGSSSPGEEGVASACLGHDTAGSDLRWTRPRGMSEHCAICLNEVTVWVALRPCGHTACRDCVSRIVEMSQTCHICRGSIEGVLPVYI